jgi:quinol---cytochrome c reductase iron-sulfur subunit
VSRFRRWVTAGVALLLARSVRRLGGRERIIPRGRPQPRAEWAVMALLGLASLCAVAVPVIYALDSLPRRTQLLGLAFGLAFLLVGAALIVAGKRLVVTEELEEDYPEPEHPEAQEEAVQIIEEGGDRVVRRRFLALAVAGAAGAIGVAVITPLASLGPVFSIAPFFRTPWRRGRRLVDESGAPIRAADIGEGAFYTGFPEGARREQIAAPLVLVRLPPGQLELPDALRGYDADGILAFSKICTHAACAISLYRSPLFRATSPRPALVCPCHYSTFDPATGGTVIFGPASRPLPMLPLRVDAAGVLRAAGNFNEAPGPSWWGVRMRKPTT